MKENIKYPIATDPGGCGVYGGASQCGASASNAGQGSPAAPPLPFLQQTTARVEKYTPPPMVPVPTKVVLELTIEDAKKLATLMRAIGGGYEWNPAWISCPNRSSLYNIRETTNAVYHALVNAGVEGL